MISGAFNTISDDFSMISRRYILFVSITTKVIALLLGSVLVDRKAQKLIIQNAARFFYHFSTCIHIGDQCSTILKGADFNVPASIWNRLLFGHSYTYQVVHAHFLTNNLNGPPIKYLGLIDYLLNQPSPLKHPKQTPISYLGLF